MDTKRVILYGLLFFIGLTLWTNWQKENISAPYIHKKAGAEQAAHKVPEELLHQAKKATSATLQAEQTKESKTPADRLIHVKTDVLDIQIDTHGGDIISTKLLAYPEKLHATDQPFVLLNDNPETRYNAISGLTNLPKGKTQDVLQYRAKQKEYQLAEGQHRLQVDLSWQQGGISVHKTLEFNRDSYVANVEYLVKNDSSEAWEGHLYSQLIRRKPGKAKRGLGMSSYTGAAISNPEHKLYEKVKFKNMNSKNLSRVVKGGWVAMQEHYFLTAWVPAPQQQNHYYTRVSDNDLYTIGLIGPALQLAPGEKAETSAKLYMGPEITAKLKQVAPGLDLTIDFGWLWIISSALFWLLQHIYNIIGNWGWSIIAVTILIKLAFYRLSSMSYKSMAAMRNLTPRLTALRERYVDDKAGLSQATMELYKREKVNPMAGCLPIIIQIPFFIALYYVLLESVELRQAPFILWIQDLSAKDPFYILPLVMGATMWMQQKLNPAPPDPMQAKMMMLMPIVFTALFMNFPAGLVLYWTVNNSLSILQQWYIMRTVSGASR